MKHTQNTNFDEEHLLEKLRHYLPQQAPLKDFIHHNTLHAFQDQPFHQALGHASNMFGYKTYLTLAEYREKYAQNEITESQLKRAISKVNGEQNIDYWMDCAINKQYTESTEPFVGKLRKIWKESYRMNMDKTVHPILFRFLSNYLDQGVSIRQFPIEHKGLISSLRELESMSKVSIFTTERPRQLLLHSHCKMEHLLNILIGEPSLYEQYIFDQQFEHPGWSGMVATIEQHPQTLLDSRKISLYDFIVMELLLEIDALDKKYGKDWLPLGKSPSCSVLDFTIPEENSELQILYSVWQESFEWSYYDSILNALQHSKHAKKEKIPSEFDAFLCIDDRECSFRRHIESESPGTRTFGTPGFFNIECYFQPEHCKFYTKICPAPLSPKYLIKEYETKSKRSKDPHFTKHSHSLIFGWFISQTLGFWSAFKLLINIFKPSISPATSYSFRHMDRHSSLTIEYKPGSEKIHGLQVGYTFTEMTDRVEGLLKSIGYLSDFAPIIYVIGHGASSVNNTHFAGYDCGACSGRPGSVNARAFAFMANHPEVRTGLRIRGINIPESTIFIGALHDTTRDEIEFYDEAVTQHKEAHAGNKIKFNKALQKNALERANRFELIESSGNPDKVYEQVKLRSVSLFEPRPELNHATNALCVIGRRELTQHLFLDRRAFLNSYNYRLDNDGRYLLNILKAAAPVCGGINLEYYFSRTDNYRLGAGTKLPHNVMGLIGVTNGADGDLLPGLPNQMIEVHEPLRLLMIIEHIPEIVLNVLNKHPETKEWFSNQWIHLIVKNPLTNTIHLFKNDDFEEYFPINESIAMDTNGNGPEIPETVKTTTKVYEEETVC